MHRVIENRLHSRVVCQIIGVVYNLCLQNYIISSSQYHMAALSCTPIVFHILLFQSPVPNVEILIDLRIVGSSKTLTEPASKVAMARRSLFPSHLSRMKSTDHQCLLYRSEQLHCNQPCRSFTISVTYVFLASGSMPSSFEISPNIITLGTAFLLPRCF